MPVFPCRWSVFLIVCSVVSLFFLVVDLLSLDSFLDLIQKPTMSEKFLKPISNNTGAYQEIDAFENALVDLVVLLTWEEDLWNMWDQERQSLKVKGSHERRSAWERQRFRERATMIDDDDAVCVCVCVCASEAMSKWKKLDWRRRKIGQRLEEWAGCKS